MRVATVFETVSYTISFLRVDNASTANLCFVTTFADPVRHLLNGYFRLTSHLQLVCLHFFSLTFHMHFSLLPCMLHAPVTTSSTIFRPKVRRRKRIKKCIRTSFSSLHTQQPFHWRRLGIPQQWAQPANRRTVLNKHNNHTPSAACVSIKVSFKDSTQLHIWQHIFRSQYAYDSFRILNFFENVRTCFPGNGVVDVYRKISK